MALRSQLTPPVTGIPPRPRTSQVDPWTAASRKRAAKKTVSITPGSGVSHVPGFAPYQPAVPPWGTYDPTLDANLGAATRGFNDLTADTERQNTRSANDLTLGIDAVNQQKGYSLADNLRTRERTNADYGTATTALGKRYSDLGNAQAQGAQQAGVVGGGALADALLKRTANQGVDQAGLDTTRNRTLADLLTSDNRIGQAATDKIGGLTLDYNRGVEDRNQVALPRASRELTQFGIDTTAQKGYQASSSGLWQAPPKPTNEFTSPGGQAYRVLKSSKGNKFMLPDGTIVTKRPA